MKLEEALSIIEQVCAQYVGTLKDHQAIQQAIAVVKKELSHPVLIQDGQDVGMTETNVTP